jgi:hypothetical protein
VQQRGTINSTKDAHGNATDRHASDTVSFSTPGSIGCHSLKGLQVLTIYDYDGGRYLKKKEQQTQSEFWIPRILDSRMGSLVKSKI